MYEDFQLQSNVSEMGLSLCIRPKRQVVEKNSTSMEQFITLNREKLATISNESRKKLNELHR